MLITTLLSLSLSLPLSSSSFSLFLFLSTSRLLPFDFRPDYTVVKHVSVHTYKRLFILYKRGKLFPLMTQRADECLSPNVYIQHS